MDKWDTLHPDFRHLAERVYRRVEDMCVRVGCTPLLVSTWRSPEKQWELFKKGRREVGGKWIRVPGTGVVTNARPNETPHCITLADGTPAACAMDVALIENGKWLPDRDVRWSIIPASVALAARGDLTSGAMFSTIRDYPHIEWKEWKKWRAT